MLGNYLFIQVFIVILIVEAIKLSFKSLYLIYLVNLFESNQYFLFSVGI